MILLSLRDSILQYTGISDVYIGDVVTALIFGVSVILIFALLGKFIFRM